MERFIIVLGSIFGDEEYYRSLFSELLGILCSSRHPNSMSSWSTAYVFKWVSQKLFTFGYHLGQEKSSHLSKKKLFLVLKEALTFSLSVEQGMYLMSDEFKSWNTRMGDKPRQFVQSAGQTRSGAGRSTVGPGVQSIAPTVNQPTPIAQQWCVQHASNALGVSLHPCKGDSRGGPCSRMHPDLSRPLSDQTKVKLKGIANVIQKPDFKSKFLAAIV